MFPDVSCFNWSKAAVAVDENQENIPVFSA